ncbi:hypothetical protein ONR57_22990 [Hoyosella sp. YIM 151337]|uniref:hypothetical protein n=1 Tax=Hoyosella sp. YIM 151337 TaxID=2992742 RepID=UPI0022356ABE|nr:hypothetical protein [Hoyosella sp. YIM 151337]MCW4356177.1 hypothetical protein [Hoyosella sp. YIM 151337]
MSITATLDQIQAQLEDVTRANPRIDYEFLACVFVDLYGPRPVTKMRADLISELAAAFEGTRTH